MDPVVVALGPLALPVWSLFMLLAVGIGAGLYWWGVFHYGMDVEKAMWLFLGALLGGVFGGKLGMVFFLGPDVFFGNLPVLARAGMTYTGALIGSYLGVRLMERFTGTRCRCGLFALPIPLVQAIGRLGNFFAADAYGTPTRLPWGVEQAGAVRHPVQLYEAALDLVLFGVMWRLRGRFAEGDGLFKVYLVGYAAIRLPLEFLRYQPTPRDWLGLTAVQWLCLATLATAAIGWGWKAARARSGAGTPGRLRTAAAGR